MKVLILAAGKGDLDLAEGGYPLCLTEFEGKPLIERLILACKAIDDAQLIVILRADEIAQFHLDDVVRLVDPHTSTVKVENDTRGATCSALLAIKEIDNDDELLIINGNELIDADFNSVIGTFRAKGLAAGTLTFPSVHPRYSYVRIGADDRVVEAAEKRPISRHATMGFYWFRRGHDFVQAAKEMIRNDDSVGGMFFVCPTLNDLILRDLPVGYFPLPSTQFHPLKTERQILSFESNPEKVH